MEQILKFLLELLNKIIEMLGGSPKTTPQPEQPNVPENPVDPCDPA